MTTRRPDKNTAVIRRRGKPARIVLQHAYTKETAIAEIVHRGPKTVILWGKLEEEPDEDGFIAGGWRILQDETNNASSKRVRRELPESIEKDMAEFSDFLDRGDDE